jgi:hypothetical protein
MDGLVDSGLGAGLASLAFWGFIAAMVVGGIWDGARKRDAQHETLRRLIDSGKPVDEALMKRLMVGEPKRADRDLGIGAIIVFSIAVGLGVLSMALGDDGEPLIELLGVAGLVACLAAGLWGASIHARRTRREDDARGHTQDAG